MAVAQEKPKEYVHEPYPSTRFHDTQGFVEGPDADDEIAKCGEISDTKTGKPNKSGWKDTPYPAKPKPAPITASASDQGFVLEIYKKLSELQAKQGEHETRLDALESAGRKK